MIEWITTLSRGIAGSLGLDKLSTIGPPGLLTTLAIAVFFLPAPDALRDVDKARATLDTLRKVEVQKLARAQRDSVSADRRVRGVMAELTRVEARLNVADSLYMHRLRHSVEDGRSDSLRARVDALKSLVIGDFVASAQYGTGASLRADLDRYVRLHGALDVAVQRRTAAEVSLGVGKTTLDSIDVQIAESFRWGRTGADYDVAIDNLVQAIVAALVLAYLIGIAINPLMNMLFLKTSEVGSVIIPGRGNHGGDGDGGGGIGGPATPGGGDGPDGGGKPGAAKGVPGGKVRTLGTSSKVSLSEAMNAVESKPLRQLDDSLIRRIPMSYWVGRGVVSQEEYSALVQGQRRYSELLVSSAFPALALSAAIGHRGGHPQWGLAVGLFVGFVIWRSGVAQYKRFVSKRLALIRARVNEREKAIEKERAREKADAAKKADPRPKVKSLVSKVDGLSVASQAAADPKAFHKGLAETLASVKGELESLPEAPDSDEKDGDSVATSAARLIRVLEAVIVGGGSTAAIANVLTAMAHLFAEREEGDDAPVTGGPE